MSGRKNLFLAKIKCEPIFFRVLWQFFNPKRPLKNDIGRRLDGGNRRPSLFNKIVSNIFVNSQPIIIKRFFQQRPPAHFGFKSEFFTFCPAKGGTGQKQIFSAPLFGKRRFPYEIYSLCQKIY